MSAANIGVPRLKHQFDHRRLAGSTVEVVGMARSGEAAVELLIREGANVIAAELDGGKRSALESRFQGKPVRFQFGPHRPIEGVELIIVSPGVPCTGDLFEWAQARSVPVVSELELASRFCRRPLVAVTGTNGKTTVTGMIGHILARYGIGGDVAGNVGFPLSRLVIEGRADGGEPLVVEVSSFQLDTIDRFHPCVAVICNLAPDHLDRYSSLEDYYRSKTRISLNQTPEEDLWIGPGVAEQIQPETRAEILTFDVSEHNSVGLCESGDSILYRTRDCCETVEIPQWRERLVQNRLNALAAAGAACSLGVPLRAALKALEDYRPPRHRLEFIARVGEIDCYNDSKATNVHATEAALRSLPAPIILIAGGRHKGDSLDPLLPLIREKVRHIYLLGEAARSFARAWAPVVAVSLVQDVREAVKRALGEQRGPATLLLSPACASWDMYQSYEARGEEFEDAVREAAG